MIYKIIVALILAYKKKYFNHGIFFKYLYKIYIKSIYNKLNCKKGENCEKNFKSIIDYIFYNIVHNFCIYCG